MPHNWTPYEAAKEIGEKLCSMGLVSTLDRDRVRGVIQIVLEDNYSVRRLRE